MEIYFYNANTTWKGEHVFHFNAKLYISGVNFKNEFCIDEYQQVRTKDLWTIKKLQVA
jgi:hypothetical protein